MRVSLQLGVSYVEGFVTDVDLEIMGRMLWESLDPQNALEEANDEGGSAVLPIIIESSSAEVQALPWEALYHPRHGFLARHPSFTLTRRIPATAKSPSQLEKGPLRILLFTSLPEDVSPGKGRLNIEEEQFQVQEALLPWIARGLVQLEMPDDGRFSTLRELLVNFRPHVLFLSGHGRFHHAPHAGEAYGEFLFESETGDTEAVKEGAIADVLRDTGVQAVVLSACESGKAASDMLSHGLARRISAQGIPHVIGMRESLADKAGIRFAHSLCDSLAGQEFIDYALQCARKNISEVDERGQWCLPMLISSQPHTPLIDWDFHLQGIDTALRFRNTLGDVSLPARFMGRRAEMRRYKSRLIKGDLAHLLITGPGGQGKTSLAGKLALDLQKRGWQVFAWSANLDKPWRNSELEMEQSLDELRVDRYNRLWPRAKNEYERARGMIGLLMEQFHGHVAFFLDNLESVQDPGTGALTDALVAAWVDIACRMQDLIVLATSRRQIPYWEGEHLMLSHASYGDFLQMAQALLPLPLLNRRDKMRRVYDVLGGNCRGLEFFSAAARNMKSEVEEHVFLDVLEQSKGDLQANMAIGEVYRRLPESAQMLLHRLPAYHVPVTREGLLNLADKLPDPETLVECLLSASLLEASYKPNEIETQYQCNPLAEDWLRGKKLTDTEPIWLDAAVNYHLYVLKQKQQNLDQARAAYQTFRQEKRDSEAEHLIPTMRIHERQVLTQAFTAYDALNRAGRFSEADRLALSFIVGPLTMAGSYTRLLESFLPRICKSGDVQTRARALGNSGFLWMKLGDYKQALLFYEQALVVMQQTGNRQGEAAILSNIAQIHYIQGHFHLALERLEQALAIYRQIHDRAGEGAALNNIAAVYQARGDYHEALRYFEQALAMQRLMRHRQGEGAALGNIAQIYSTWGTYDTALSCLGQALEIQQQIGDKAGEGITRNNISSIYQRRGEYETALAYLREALAIQQQIEDRAGQGTTRNNISSIYQRQGDYESALEELDNVLVILKEIGDRTKEASTLNNISGVYRRQGDFKKAYTYLVQALEMQQQIGDRAGECTTLNNMATISRAWGDYNAALAQYGRVLATRQMLGDLAGEGLALNNIAAVLQAQGECRMALEKLEQALAIMTQVGSKAGESTTLNNIALIHKEKGEYETALEYLQKSLAITQFVGDKMGEGTTRNNIASLHYPQNKWDAALLECKEALTIRRQIGDRAGEAESLNNLSQICFCLQEDPQISLRYLEQAEVIQNEIGDKTGCSITLMNMGHLYMQSRQDQRAVLVWTRAYIIAREMNLSDVLRDLAKLAPDAGLPEGLDGWDVQAHKLQEP